MKVSTPPAAWTKIDLAYDSFVTKSQDVEEFLQKMEEVRLETIEKGLFHNDD